MRINIYYPSKSYESTCANRSYTLNFTNFGSGMHISVAPIKSIYNRPNPASISFNSNKEALSFAHSIISMIHLGKKELKVDVKGECQ